MAVEMSVLGCLPDQGIVLENRLDQAGIQGSLLALAGNRLRPMGNQEILLD
ncbi:hypothetical protein NCCP2222_29240 [Sporosarcina sp. NCCP-2222]|nr:hypothetical protein NCCP2222_29240 [Sporosarcina sp. NCCP-2222]